MAGPKVMPGAEEEVEFFMGFPWCREQLEQKGSIAVPRLDQETDGRGSTGELFSKTLNTSSTIAHRIVLMMDPSTPGPHPAQSSKEPWLPLTTISVFFVLGQGLCGFGDICHGGIQTTLLDDAAGVLAVLNGRLQDGMLPTTRRDQFLPSNDNNAKILNLGRNMVATQGMEVQLLRPLRTPRVVQVTAHLQKIEADGSCFYLESTIKDANGKEYARAKTRWAVFPPRGKL